MDQQEARARLHQRYRSTCDHVCHHLLWHLEQQRALAQAILAFFQQREALDQQYAAALRKMAPIPVTSAMSPALRGAMGELSAAPAKTADAIASAAQALAQGPHKRMAELLAAMDAANRSVKAQMGAALQGLAAAFQDIQALHAALQRAVAGPAPTDDPYLIALKIKKAVHHNGAVQEGATDALRALLQNARKMHGVNLRQLKAVLQEYLSCHQLVPVQQLKVLDHLAGVCNSLDGADYHATVVELYQSVGADDLHPEDDVDAKLVEALQQASRATQMPFQYDLQSLVKRQGILQRKTAFLGRWKPQLFVLTRFGYLHYFGPDLLTPEATYHLARCQVEAGEEPDTFVLVEPSMLMSSRIFVKCPGKEDLLQWVADLRDDCARPGAA